MNRFLRIASIAMIVLIIIVLGAVFADVIVDYSACTTQNIKNQFAKPSAEHIFGTDKFGRDVFARVLHGARISLVIGVCSALGSMLIACVLGSCAGYYGGKVETVIMRFIDILMCIPSILLTLCLVAILGGSTRNLIIALTIGLIPTFTRVVRSVIINVKGSDYIEAAKASGSSDFRIIATHILPNAIGPIIVQATMNVANSILSAASFSFIGLGIQPPTPEWGTMLSEAKDVMTVMPSLAIIPGLAIAITALAFNLVGDGLRDALDPKLKD